MMTKGNVCEIENFFQNILKNAKIDKQQLISYFETLNAEINVSVKYSLSYNTQFSLNCSFSQSQPENVDFLISESIENKDVIEENIPESSETVSNEQIVDVLNKDAYEINYFYLCKDYEKPEFFSHLLLPTSRYKFPCNCSSRNNCSSSYFCSCSKLYEEKLGVQKLFIIKNRKKVLPRD